VLLQAAVVPLLVQVPPIEVTVPVTALVPALVTFYFVSIFNLSTLG